MALFDRLSFFSGNPEPVMNELIREAADFYMNVYPQLTHGVEYKKIGIALITEYPCLACEDTINPHVSKKKKISVELIVNNHVLLFDRV